MADGSDLNGNMLADLGGGQRAPGTALVGARVATLAGSVLEAHLLNPGATTEASTTVPSGATWAWIESDAKVWVTLGAAIDIPTGTSGPALGNVARLPAGGNLWPVKAGVGDGKLHVEPLAANDVAVLFLADR